MTKFCSELINLYIILVVLVANIDGNTSLDLLFKDMNIIKNISVKFFQTT